MKEAHWHVTSGKNTLATGIVYAEDGKTLDAKTINIAANAAKLLGILPEVGVMIWRPNKEGGSTGHKKAALRGGRVKEGEPAYKAIAA